MSSFRRASWLSSALLVLAVTAARGEGPVYIDPANAGEDYAVQGEYVGELPTENGRQMFGVQVIARGKGQFEAVAYGGGLPGAGWNGEEPLRVAGKRENGEVVFTTEGGKGVARGGKLLALNDQGVTVAELQRIERRSPTLGQKPPDGAIVLFDGTNTDQWQDGKLTDDGLLMQGTTSIPKFQDHQVHIEFRLPFQPEDEGQARGNSGIYLQGRYEVQMLDSFGLEGKNNECGGIYSLKAPDVNMCFPPLTWQTYDIEFTAARYDEQGNQIAKPRITVRHNGEVIHRNVELPDETTRGAPVAPGPEPGPIYLQDHGNPVRYRNIWVISRPAD